MNRGTMIPPSPPAGSEPSGEAFDAESLCVVMAERSPLPMATVEGAGHTVRYVNPAFCRLMGKSAGELVGRGFIEILPEQSRCVAVLDRVYQTGRSENHTETEPSKADPIFWSYTMWALPADGPFIGVMLQVTETTEFHARMVATNQALLLGALRQHEMTEAAEKLNQQLKDELAARHLLEKQLRQSQKMEAVGQLTAGIAHDFNNLLTVINGYSGLLMEGMPASDVRHGSLTAIREAGELAAGLTRQLLAFSRQTVLSPRVLNLNRIIEDSEKMLRRLLGEEMVISLVLDRSIRHVKVDAGLMAQVLMNLAVNARDAMEGGGKLTIETSNVMLDESRVQAGIPRGQYVLLAMTDTGCGMSGEVLARIFEPFYSTKGVGKGTGLGLAVVHGIIKQSGGHIEVESSPGKGTTFKIYLPAVSEAPLVAEKVRAGLQLRGTETILVAEDDFNLRKMVTISLEDYGYTILKGVDGADALRVAEAFGGKIDLLLTDVVMPNLGGRELAAALQPRFPGMKILYLSGYTDDVILRHGILKADFAFLQKPYSPSMLRQKVREVLDERKGVGGGD